MKKKVNKSKSSKSSKFYLLDYVEGCTSKVKKFKTLKALNEFVLDFQAQYPNTREGDNWINYAVTNIAGEVIPYDNSVTVE
jgi:hypothetical protein